MVDTRTSLWIAVSESTANSRTGDPLVLPIKSPTAPTAVLRQGAIDGLKFSVSTALSTAAQQAKLVLFQLDWGDGSAIYSSPVASAPSHYYSATGHYFVTLTVTDDVGQSDSCLLQVAVTAGSVVHHPPIAVFTYSGTRNVVKVDGSTSTADDSVTTWKWDWSDGAASTGAAAQHAYTSAGTYPVTLTVIDDRGVPSVPTTHQITVAAPNQPPIASFTRAVSGLSVKVDGTNSTDADGSIVDYDWDWGDKSSHSSGSTASHQYAKADTYDIVLTVTDNLGAKGTSTHNAVATGTVTSGSTAGGGVAYSALKGSSFASRVNSAGAKPVALSAATYGFSNFDDHGNYGADLTSGGLLGAGIGQTIIAMDKNSSTHKSPSGGTNQDSLLRFTRDKLVLDDFTLLATTQKNLYNGMRLSGVTAARLSNILVKGIPGNKNYPPGETFAINDFAGGGNAYDTVTVDGANVGASGFATNGAGGKASFKQNTYEKCVAKSLKYSAGWALWRTNCSTLTDCKSIDNHTGLLVEQCTGTFKFIRHTFSGNDSKDIYFAGMSSIGTAKIQLIDPIHPDGKIRIYCNGDEGHDTNTSGHQNQKKSDVTVFRTINGKLVQQNASDYVTFQGDWA